MEIFEEHIDLSILTQIIPPRIERKRVLPNRRNTVQVRIQPLLSRQFPRPRKMVIKLIWLHHPIYILRQTITIVPLHRKMEATIIMNLYPPLLQSVPFQIRIPLINRKRDLLILDMVKQPLCLYDFILSVVPCRRCV